MIPIHSLLPPFSTPTLKDPKRGEITVAGAMINKDAPPLVNQEKPQKYRGKDRREQNLPPLVDTRTGGDRRSQTKRPRINLEV